MNVRIASLVALLAVPVVGCSGAAPSDQAPASESADALGGAATGRRLADSNVDQVVAAAEALVRDHVAILTAAHPSIHRITRATRVEFTYVAQTQTSFMEVSELIDAVLETQSSVAPSTLVGRVDALLRPHVERSTNAAGVVKCSVDNALGLLSYAACERAEHENAFSRVASPTGIDFDEIRAAWKKTTERGHNFDSALILPVAFDREPTLQQIRKAAGIRVAFGEAGLDAIDDFAGASESAAAENPQEFAPIARALRGAGIKKRFSFNGGGEGWSRHVLVVIDEHNQVWGFESGYSE